MRILLIEDDIGIAQTIETKVASEGGVLDLSMVGEEGLEFSKMYKYDLIILDITLDIFVCKIRKKLYKASGGMNYIETVWGRGYALKEKHGDQGKN